MNCCKPYIHTFGPDACYKLSVKGKIQTHSGSKKPSPGQICLHFLHSTLFLVLFASLLMACGSSGKRNRSLSPESAESPGVSHPVSGEDSAETRGTHSDPVVNVFIENSGSMDGYVAGVTRFEQAIYNFLTDIRISGFSDSLNLFYVNSRIIPQRADLREFIEELEPSAFQSRGGNRGVSDLSQVFETVLSETAQNDVAILVTDGIFSPGRGRDADHYLISQQIELKEIMADYLKRYPNTAVRMYQLSSQFNGYYYNREDASTRLNADRPFYIWVIGDTDHLVDLVEKVPDERFSGGGVQHTFSITPGNKEIDYAVRMGSGNFDLDRNSPRNTIQNLKMDTRGRRNEARFSVTADFSGFLIDDTYIRDVNNWEFRSDYNLTIVRTSSHPQGHTHQLNVSSDRVYKGIASFKLMNEIPSWVDEINDDVGTTAVEGKTFGIKYQIQGIFEAFTYNTNSYTELKININ